MTQATLDTANEIRGQIGDLSRIVSEFKKGASMRIEGTSYGHPITSKFVQEQISKSIILGLEAKIANLEKEFKNL